MRARMRMRVRRRKGKDAFSLRACELEWEISLR